MSHWDLLQKKNFDESNVEHWYIWWVLIVQGLLITSWEHCMSLHYLEPCSGVELWGRWSLFFVFVSHWDLLQKKTWMNPNLRFDIFDGFLYCAGYRWCSQHRLHSRMEAPLGTVLHRTPGRTALRWTIQAVWIQSHQSGTVVFYCSLLLGCQSRFLSYVVQSINQLTSMSAFKYSPFLLWNIGNSRSNISGSISSKES